MLTATATLALASCGDGDSPVGAWVLDDAAVIGANRSLLLVESRATAAALVAEVEHVMQQTEAWIEALPADAREAARTEARASSLKAGTAWRELAEALSRSKVEAQALAEKQALEWIAQMGTRVQLRLLIDLNGTFTARFTARTGTDASNGTWTWDGDTLRLTPRGASGGPLRAQSAEPPSRWTLEGGRLHATVDGHALVLTRD